MAWLPLGFRARSDDESKTVGQQHPFDALVGVVSMLLRPGERCLVEFSGGCDSSLVLAAAVKACRIAGTEAPVPVTFRFPGIRETYETSYQELVIASLGLSDWLVMTDTDGSFDVLSASAQGSLREHGVFFPGTFHNRSHVFQQVSPCVLLTGEGGDELFGERRLTGVRRAARSLRHGMRIGRAGRELLPALATRNYRRSQSEKSISSGWSAEWLKNVELRQSVIRALATEEALEPLDPHRFVEYYNSLNRMSVTDNNCRAYAALHGVSWEAPLGDPRFTASLLRAVPRTRYTGRNDLFRLLFGDQLPDQILDRTGKTHFTRAFLGVHTRSFADRWTGTGVPDGVDSEWLAHHWRTATEIHGGTLLLLQHAWLHDEVGRTSAS